MTNAPALTRTLLALVALSPMAMAETLTFERSQTFDGFHERTYSSGWTDLAPDVKNLLSTDSNGDLRGFQNGVLTTWIESPVFTLTPGALTIAEIYLIGGVDSAPNSDAGVSSTSSASGWAGVALRDLSGNFVLTYSIPTVWAPISFTSLQLAPFVGQSFTLDFISMNNSDSDFFNVNRPINIPGTLGAVPEPSPAWFGGLTLLGVLSRRKRQR